MVSPRKLAANTQNATKSTGPRTVAGKRRSKMNATAHGLRAIAPVLPGEDPAAWDAFRAGVAADLCATGALETELAERVAVLTWRLRRVATFEVASAVAPPPPPAKPFGYFSLPLEPAPEEPTPEDVAEDLAAAERELADLRHFAELLPKVSAGESLSGPDGMRVLRRLATYLPEPDAPEADIDVDADEFLAALGVPERWTDCPEAWDGWTPEVMRTGLERLATPAEWTVERLLTTAAHFDAEDVAAGILKVDGFRCELATATAGKAEREANAARRKAVPDEAALAAVMRYEPHLAGQLAQALDMLARVQDARRAHLERGANG